MAQREQELRHGNVRLVVHVCFVKGQCVCAPCHNIRHGLMTHLFVNLGFAYVIASSYVSGIIRDMLTFIHHTYSHTSICVYAFAYCRVCAVVISLPILLLILGRMGPTCDRLSHPHSALHTPIIPKLNSRAKRRHIIPSPCLPLHHTHTHTHAWFTAVHTSGPSISLPYRMPRVPSPHGY